MQPTRVAAMAPTSAGTVTALTCTEQAQINLDSDAEVAYARLGALSQAIKNELQNDLNIHDKAILPAFVNLPQVTAAEYSSVRPRRSDCAQPKWHWSMFTLRL